MDFKAEQMLSAELTRGERLLWGGMPRQGLRLRASDWYMVPFSLMWGGFALFWEYMALTNPRSGPTFFALWGIPFVLIGLYMMVGRFFVDSYQRTKTYYGVTDRRVLILSGLINRRITSVALQNLGDVSLSERADRSGSIAFGASRMAYPASWDWSGQVQGPAFDLIDDARRVYDVVQEAQRTDAARSRA